MVSSDNVQHAELLHAACSYQECYECRITICWRKAAEKQQSKWWVHKKLVVLSQGRGH